MWRGSGVVGRSRIRPGTPAKRSAGGRFFYPGPLVPHPPRNRGLVTLFGAAGGPLAAPTQLAQDTPRLGAGVTQTSALPDDMNDTVQRPQLGRKAPSAGPLQQGRLQTSLRRNIQARFSSCPTCALEALFPVPPPGGIPAAGRLSAHVQLMDNVGLAPALCEERRCLQPARLQSSKVTSRSNGCVHARRLPRPGQYVTIL